MNTKKVKIHTVTHTHEDQNNTRDDLDIHYLPLVATQIKMISEFKNIIVKKKKKIVNDVLYLNQEIKYSQEYGKYK